MIFVATCPVSQKEKSWIHHVSKDSWKGVWIASDLKDLKQAEEVAPEQDVIILYMHGGGFVEGYSYMYMDTFQAIIRKLKNEHGGIQASILSLEYSPSPEHKWPKACTEAIACYQYLIHDLSVSPSRVILAGDSAGGNLVATTLLQLKELRNEKKRDLPPLPLPAGAALLSPWVDMTLDVYPNLPDTITAKLLGIFKTRYVTMNELQNPLVSPVYGDFSGINCPFLIAYASQEILKPSIETFVSHLDKRDGCNVTVLKGGPTTTHIWLVCSLMAASNAVYEKDCDAFIKWMATTRQQQ